MPYPNTGRFGIIENPLLFTPFVEDNTEGGGEFSDNDFLLLDGEFFLLLDGTHFLLLGS